jgi:hypothetical protein
MVVPATVCDGETWAEESNGSPNDCVWQWNLDWEKYL